MTKASKLSIVIVGVLLICAAGAYGVFAWRFEMFPAIDYDAEGRTLEERLALVEQFLGGGRLPASAADPHMYQLSGKDAIMWIGFRVARSDVQRVKRAICEKWGPEPVALPLPPPPAIASWWLIRRVREGKASPARLAYGKNECEPTLQVWIVDEAAGVFRGLHMGS